MAIFRLNVENDNLHNAELVIAKKTDIELEKHLESWLENMPGGTWSKENLFSGLVDRRVLTSKKVLSSLTCSASIPRETLVIVRTEEEQGSKGTLSRNYLNTRHGQKNSQLSKFMK